MPRNRGPVTTLLAGLSLTGMAPAMTVEGGTDTAVFATYLEHFLLPSLRPGQIVVVDKVGAHKPDRIRALVEAAGCRLVFLPALLAGLLAGRGGRQLAQDPHPGGRRPHSAGLGRGDRRRTGGGHRRRRRRLVRPRRLPDPTSSLITAVSVGRPGRGLERFAPPRLLAETAAPRLGPAVPVQP